MTVRGFSVVFHIFVAIDAAVNEVVDALKNKADKYTDGTSMYDNTYIVFTSDNGGSNDNGASTYPLKGSKGSFFEGGEMSWLLLFSQVYCLLKTKMTPKLAHMENKVLYG